MKTNLLRRTLAWLALAAALPVASAAEEPVILRVGFFPNLTHSPALVARQLQREQNDWHLAHLPKGSKIEWRSFNAGPSAMEALLAGAVDVTYVGPSPTINAHVRTKGNEIRILAPVARGGNALVVRQGSGLKVPKDFIGKRLATPQLGNTQDIDARVWLRDGGLKVTVNGGDAKIIPAQNAELVLLFSRGDIDAAWTVEPWVTRLVNEFGGEILVEKKEAPITLLVTSVAALGHRRAEIEAFVRSHQALRDQLLADRPSYERLVRAGLSAETRSTPQT
jgi:NitT/TauT family transport system substrate-binding protein